MKKAGTAARLTTVAACAALVTAVAIAARALGAESAAAPPEAGPMSSPDELTDAAGRDKTATCAACHSLDYIRMNSRFLDLAGWTAVVNKMIKVYGAPIPPEDVETIAGYLAQNYGKAD